MAPGRPAGRPGATLLAQVQATRRRPRIALLRGTPGIGDLLCAVPSWRALRAAVPEARVTLIAQPALTEPARRFGAYIDDLLPFPGFPGLPDAGDDVRATVAFLAEAQERHFDLVIQQHGSGRVTNLLVELLGGRRVAGFCGERAHVPPGGVFLPYPVGRHEVHRHLALMELLGAPPRGDQLELPITDEDRAAAAALRPTAAGGYAVLHPGAKVAGRRWPVASFARVARALAHRGMAVVVTGSDRERALAECVAEAGGPSATSVAGATDLGTLAALIDGAALVVTNDTGASHVAVARRTPSIVVTPSGLDPTWLPLDRQRHHVVAGADGHPEPAAVLAAIDALAGSVPDGVWCERRRDRARGYGGHETSVAGHSTSSRSSHPTG
jgi:ADP-heptose:LPS heptosyltransferase